MLRCILLSIATESNVSEMLQIKFTRQVLHVFRECCFHIFQHLSVPEITGQVFGFMRVKSQAVKRIAIRQTGRFLILLNVCSIRKRYPGYEARVSSLWMPVFISLNQQWHRNTFSVDVPGQTRAGNLFCPAWESCFSMTCHR
jgi:hypothetical protein